MARTVKGLSGVVLLSLLLACSTVQPRTGDGTDRFSELSSHVRQEMEAQHIPGLQLVITRDGEAVYSQAFGYADLAHRVEVTDTTRFQSGSIAKTATALGIALLERSGALAFDDPLTNFFPDAPEAWSEITVWDLVDQTSGLQDPDLGWTADFSEVEYLEEAYAVPPAFPPGQYYVYQNVNFSIAGMITSRIAGRPWAEFQRDRIFHPLGMDRTHAVRIREIVPSAARGYQWEEGRLLRAAPTFSQSVWDLATGSLWTTASDWSRLLNSYLQADLFPREYVDRVLLSSRELNSGYPANYSFGNWIGSINGHRTIEHGGGNPGFRTFAILYPDKRMTLVLMTNASHDLRPLAHQVAGLFDPDLRVPTRTEIEVENLERFEGLYYFPDWGETAVVVDEGALILDAGWFRDECRMYAPTACTPGGEVSFEFLVGEDGAVTGILYRDSAYDLGWRIERAGEATAAPGEPHDR